MNEQQKTHILRLPNPEYSNPPAATDTEIAISIPIFHSNIDSNCSKFDASRLKEIHLKSAVWAALSFINNTDLIDNGVGIYFHIEDTIADVALEAFDQYGVSRDTIRVQSIPKPKAKDILHAQYGKKLMCLSDKKINPARWLILDSDAFACSTHQKMQWYTPLCEVDQPVAMWSYTNYYIVGQNYEQWVRGACLGSGFNFDPGDSSFKQEQRAFEHLGFLDETLPANPIEVPNRHMIASQILLIPTDHEITPFLQKHYANCYQDEFLLAMWHLKHRDIRQLDQVIPVLFYSNETEYIGRDRSKDADGYVAHIAADDRIAQTKTDLYFDEFYNALLAKEQISESYTNVAARLADTTSDKEVKTYGHQYGNLYNMVFNDLYVKKGRKLRILEIGVSFFGSGSLQAYQQLDSVESVVGIDVLPYQGQLTEKAEFHLVDDAYTPATIQMLKDKHPPFDLIIDDGSHETHHQEFFLLNYGQLLSDNGKLLCEDVRDKAFFRWMCRDHNAYGFDGWANTKEDVSANHNERILLRDKPLQRPPTTQIMAPHSVRFPDYTAPKTQLTFHVPGIAYAPTHPDFNSDPFVQKIWKQCALLTNLGHTVKHYGHERSDVACTEHIDVIDNFIVEKQYGKLDHTPAAYHVTNDLAFQIFDANTEREMRKRANAGDFLLLSFSHRNLCESLSDTGMYAVESGIGYPNVYSPYKVYESNAWMHFHRGKASKTREVMDKFPDLTDVHQAIIDPHNLLSETEPDWTSCVIPNYFDLSQFEYSAQKEEYLLFIGRITQNKGLEIAFALSEYTNTRLIVAGPGDIHALGYYVPAQVEYVGIADVETRSKLMSRAMAVICPSLYIEPFLGVHIEAAACGTPVLTTNWGAPTECLIHGKTGFRCQNFDQFVYAFGHLDDIKTIDCRKHGLQFSNERVSLKFHEFYHMIPRYVEGRFWSVDPTRKAMSWLDAQMTQDEIQAQITVIQEKIRLETKRG